MRTQQTTGQRPTMAVQTRWMLCAALCALSACGPIPLNADGGLNCGIDWGVTGPARKLTAFLGAVGDFVTQAGLLDTEMRAACTRFAMDLGIPAAELQPTGNQTATQAACERVAREIRTEIAAVRAGAGLQVDVGITPPICRVRVDAFAECVGRCDVTVTPGVADIQCEGGEIRGSCSGMCTGSCSAMVSGMCSGACEGTCSASCTGTCQGRCSGTCSARATDGSCNGTCMGSCEGRCSAGCTGSCSGSCVAMASAQCMGECRGSCSATWTEPRCTGRVVPPMVDADCRASCEARVNAQAECTPASVRFAFTGISVMDLQTRATRLGTALTNSYGSVLTVAGRLARLVQAADAMVRSAQAVPNAIGELGAGAAACAIDAAARLTTAVSQVQVSVQVSVSVTASVG